MAHLRASAVFAASVLLCAAPGAHAGFRCPAKGGAEWREYRSKHFVVDTDAARFKVGLLVGQLERMHALELQALFGEQVEIPGRLRVIAFADPSLFTALVGTSRIGAFYTVSGMGEPTIVLPIEGLEAQPDVVAHEVAHYLSRFLFPRQPAWFSEGLAQFVETIADTTTEIAPATGSHIVRGQRDLRGGVGIAPRRLAGALREAPRVSLREVLQWDGSLEPASARYPLYSWLLYHWLWNNRSKQFTAFQQRLQNGDDPAAALRAELPELDPANPAIAKLDDELEQYRRSGRYVSYRVSAETGGSFSDAPPLSSADMHMLLLGVGFGTDEKEALASIDEALSEDALHPVALFARSRIDKSSAVGALRNAAAARPGDWRAWLLLGNVLDDSAKDDTENAYRKAIALNPDSSWAHSRLASHLVAHGRPKEALPIANRALDLAPADPSSMDTVAAVAAALGKCSEALVLQRRAASVASPKAAGRDEIRKRLAEYEARCGTATPASASGAPAPVH